MYIQYVCICSVYMLIVFMDVANMARPSGQAKSQLASTQFHRHTRNNNSARYGFYEAAMGGAGGAPSTIFRITSAKLMPIVVDGVRASPSCPGTKIIFACRQTMGKFQKTADKMKTIILMNYGLGSFLRSIRNRVN